MKAKIVFMTAWMLYGVSVALAAPATEIRERRTGRKDKNKTVDGVMRIW